MLSGSSGHRGEACCSSCELGDGESPTPPSPCSSAKRPRWWFAAIVVGAAVTAGSAIAWWVTRKPSRMYNDPRNDRKRTTEVPYETMDEVVWEQRR